MCHPKDAIYSIYAHLNCCPLVHHPPVNRENNSRSFDFVQACTLNGSYIKLHCALFFSFKIQRIIDNRYYVICDIVSNISPYKSQPALNEGHQSFYRGIVVINSKKYFP